MRTKCWSLKEAFARPRRPRGADDRAFALRLARSGARHPVARERMRYDPAIAQVTSRSDTADGPTAGTATVDPLEFLARLVTPIPDPGPVMPR